MSPIGKGLVVRFAGAALLAAAALLSACGQKGPLRLPESSGVVVTRPPPEGTATPTEAPPPAAPAQRGTEDTKPRVNRSDDARGK